MEVNNAPVIRGLSFRPFMGHSDYAQIASVLIASEAADHTKREVTAEFIASAYQHMNNCDPAHALDHA